MAQNARAIFILISQCVFVSQFLGVHTDAAERISDTVQTSRGPLKVTPIFHGSVMLEFDGKVIHVDPTASATTQVYPRPISLS